MPLPCPIYRTGQHSVKANCCKWSITSIAAVLSYYLLKAISTLSNVEVALSTALWGKNFVPMG